MFPAAPPIRGLRLAIATALLLAPFALGAQTDPPEPIDDFTEHTYSVFAGPIGSVAEQLVERTFDAPIQDIRVTIVSGQADDIGFVGSIQVTDAPPSCSRVGAVQAPVDVTAQVTVEGNTARLTLRAQENCCCVTGWGSATQGDRANARLHWEVTLGEPAFEVVDPNPDLIAASGLVSDPERLATQGRLVDGAAADGTTRVLLRAFVAGPGQVEFSLASGTAPDDGGVSADGEQRLGSVVVPVVETSRGSSAFAVYRVPEDFDTSGGELILLSTLETSSERSLQLRARFLPEEGTSADQTTSLRLTRPPVVLVHGLWSNAGTWSSFPLLGDDRFNVTLGDYSGTNARSFATNQLRAGAFIDEALFRLRRQGFAATQVDYGGHSMGGILGRLHIQLPRYRNPFNYFEGDIHKLLTLNTPHTGSPLANFLVTLRSIPGMSLAWRLLGKPIDEGAINDLSKGSAAIAAIAATPEPAHALVGTGGSTLTNTLLLLIPGEGALIYGVVALLDNTTDVFAGIQHDGIVGRQSQEGGLSSAATTVFSGPESLHWRVTSSGADSLRFGTLLTLPATGSEFAFFPPPATLDSFAGVAARLAPLRPATERLGIEGALLIQLPAGDTVFAGGTLPVEVLPQGAFAPERVAILTLAGSRLLTAPPFSATLDIPEDTAGELLVLAMGVDADGNVGYSDPVTLQVEVAAALEAIEVLNRDPVLFGLGETRQLSVRGFFEDGIVRDISSPSLGTFYVSANPDVATASESGLLTSVGFGTTQVVVGNPTTSALDLIEVTVAQRPGNRPPIADAGSDQTAECSSPDGAFVSLDGSASSDPDDDPLTFTWTGPFGAASGATPTVALPLGESAVVLTVEDGRGGVGSDETLVTVADSTAPSSAPASAVPATLWPPNHKMVAVTVHALATDACSPAPTCSIAGVTANEPIAGDVEITGPLSLRLRAERLGSGSGRTYTIEVACNDAAGNSAATTATVTVPHDQGH